MLLAVVVTVLLAVAAPAFGQQTCTAECNCDLSNIQMLDQIIEGKVNQSFANEPSVQILRIGGRPRNDVQLRLVTRSLRLSQDRILARINLGNGNNEATSGNIFAYRPRFQDRQNSGLAAFFINLEAVFPCLAPLSEYYPICRVYTDEDDGFRRGRDIIDTADIGNDIRVFSTTDNILTYGVAIQNCPVLNTNCWAHWTSLAVVCLLPRGACPQ